MLVTDPGITAAVAVGLASYVGYLVPLSPWGAEGWWRWPSIWLLAVVNIRGVELGSEVLRGLAALKLGVLGFLILWGLGFGHGDWSNLVPLLAQRQGSQPLVGALIGAMIAAFFSLGGWWDVSKIAGEVHDPRRTLPLALLLGVSIVTLVYILITLVFLYLVPLSRIDSSETFAFAAIAGEALFGRRGGVILTLIVIVTVAGKPGCAPDGDASGLLRDGSRRAVLPRRCRRSTRGSTRRPGRSSSRLSWRVSWSVLGTFDEILAYFMVPTVIFVALTVATVFVLRREAHDGTEPLQIPWHPIPPLLFLIPTAVMLALMVLDRAPTRGYWPGRGAARPSGVSARLHPATRAGRSGRCPVATTSRRSQHQS